MDKPQPWGPYSRDCTQGYCSYYCPQWCFFLFPPPPPSSPSRPLLSPLLIAVIATVSTAFLIVAYYLILTHYRRRARAPASPPDNPLAAWHAGQPDGLDETLINRIAACQYWSHGGLIVDGTDCSVCLSQFEDGDRVRLLPRCGHAFHVDCIDTWLKAHASCPLCRAGIFPLATTNHSNGAICTVNVDQLSESVSSGESDLESESDTTTRENVDSGRTRDVVSHDVIEIRECLGIIGRSLSMDSSLRRQADGAGSWRWSRALQSVLISPIQMKRSRSLTSTLPT